MFVKDCMTKAPITIGPKECLRDAQELMGLKRIRHLPVVDPAGKLLGLLTDRDLRRASPSPLSGADAASVDAILDGTPVERVMVRAPVAVASTQDIKEAVKLMVEKKFGALPVVDAGKLVGILSQIDVLKLVLRLK